MILITGIEAHNTTIGKTYPVKKVHLFIKNEEELKILRKIYKYSFTVLYDTGKNQSEPDKIEVYFHTTENLKSFIDKGKIRNINYDDLI